MGVIKVIDSQGDFLEFSKDNTLAFLYNENKDQLIKEFSLDNRDFYNQDQLAIDTASAANILATSSPIHSGILVFQYNPSFKTLRKIWEKDPDKITTMKLAFLNNVELTLLAISIIPLVTGFMFTMYLLDRFKQTYLDVCILSIAIILLDLFEGLLINQLHDSPNYLSDIFLPLFANLLIGLPIGMILATIYYWLKELILVERKFPHSARE